MGGKNGFYVSVKVCSTNTKRDESWKLFPKLYSLKPLKPKFWGELLQNWDNSSIQ